MRDAPGDQLADRAVRIPERNALLGQIIRTVGRVDEAAQRSLLHVFCVEPHGLKHRDEHLQAVLDRVEHIEERFFVFLHIFIVSEAEPLLHAQQRHQITEYAAALAADELAYIRDSSSAA